ncbi:MAG: hypothetical protein JST89_12820 [Cyanobacteria bacterium SZAS-4]|nr:hypothetical protein [Cyanobacteria bacterium SZAS-4]
MRVSFSLSLSKYNLNRRAIAACLLATLGAIGTSQLSSSALDKPTSDGAHGAKGSKVKVSYDVRSLHNDGTSSKEKSAEVMWALAKSDKFEMAGVNKGLRDQYVAGLSHLYANDVNQRLANCFYTQGPRAIWAGHAQSNGEKVHINKFTGPDFGGDGPGLAATIDGIAFMEESLNGKPYLVVGQELGKLMPYQNEGVPMVATGADLDKAWDDFGGQPLIVAVNAVTHMFMADEDIKAMHAENNFMGGHVVIISERRDRKEDKGKTSQHEYKLLNSWGCDDTGAPRNGWVGADELVSAMNYCAEPNQSDLSRQPTRAVSADGLPKPGHNKLARGNDGLSLNFDAKSVDWNHGSGVQDTSTGRDLEDEDGDRGLNTADSEADELKQHVDAAAEGFTAEEKTLVNEAITQILTNENDKGVARLYPISDKDKAALLHQANRLFTRSKQIYAQGLDQGDRNRALVALLHDSANPDHINQGSHNTCNVTTIIKIDAFMRPAVQAKRFVDMYTNANGDQTVKMPG